MMYRLFQGDDKDFQLLFAEAPVALAISMMDGDELLFCNNRLGQVFGVDPSELVGKPATSFYVHSKDRLSLLREFNENGFVERKEIEVQAPNGKRFWMEITCREIQLNGVAAIFSCIEDVTRHRETRKALEGSEARFRTYFEFNPVPLCVWRMNDEGDFVLEACNPASLAESGKRIAKGIGTKVSSYFEERPDVLAFFRHCVSEVGPVEKEFEFRFGGEKRIFSCHFMFVPPNTVIVHAINRTEQRRMEQELDWKRAELSHKNRLATVGKMSSVVAHEINQPLGAIANFSTTIGTLLREPKIDISKLRELFDEITTEALRAGEITRSMKRFASQAVPHRSTIDLNDAVVEVARLMAADARRYKTSISLQLTSEPLLVNADFVQIQQVLVNVMLNAIESFGPSSEKRREIRVESKREGKNLLVLVSDNGCGIGEMQAEAIFEPYFSTKESGVGLGLSISRELVESHKGRLWAAPNQVSGLTVHLEIPDLGEPQP